MAFDLFDLTLRVARGLNATVEGTATGGDATSIIDTTGLVRFADDYFNKNSGVGTAWITYDAGGAGAAGGQGRESLSVHHQRELGQGMQSPVRPRRSV